MFMPGATELLIIGGIVLLIFGAKRLPEIGKGIGGAIKEFRNVRKEISLNDRDEPKSETEEEKKSLENKLVEKVIEDIPAVKKAWQLKRRQIR